MATIAAPIDEAIQPPVTATMSEWAAQLRFEQISKDAVHQAKRFLLDSMGLRPWRLSATRRSHRA